MSTHKSALLSSMGPGALGLHMGGARGTEDTSGGVRAALTTLDGRSPERRSFPYRTSISGSGFDALREALGIHALESELVAIRERLDQLEPASRPVWFNLKRACELKGVAYNTIKSRRDLQPNGSHPDGTVGGRRLWLRATVERWCLETDADHCPSNERKGHHD